jgi:hypothetical protein
MTDPANLIGVHVEHCCARCGCKYGDDNCPVVARKLLAESECENCNGQPTHGHAHKQIIARLEDWKAKCEATTAALDELNDLTGAMPDCRLLAPVHALWDAYTNAVSELIGDRGDWLGWYMYDCDMGAVPRTTQLTNDRIITVSTLADLAKVIIDGQ